MAPNWGVFNVLARYFIRAFIKQQNSLVLGLSLSANFGYIARKGPLAQLVEQLTFNQ
jgi:hypothetical protein